MIILGLGVGLGILGANIPRMASGLMAGDGDVVARNASVFQPAPQPEAAAAPATRADSAQLTQIVAAATQGPLKRTVKLTEEQKQIVAFFERTAREMNEAGGQRLNRDLEFDHLAINGLDVRYYYTVRRNYADLNPQVILAEQRSYINQTVCNDAAVRQLIGTYGFRYSYAYLSAENRLIGRLDATLDNCPT
ncbi:hypothetical protein ATO11_02230 [Pseudaestuariivita atlantica]|uniref:Uncharacterized protein n=1 Tax=Pseudaestuariivita atlantica TaxID=1317121 RepID=A0A0L1JUU3_9RHOB|nr:hypothetical protein ATO11_02230 [Pseudaestuariivita atlantica]